MAADPNNPFAPDKSEALLREIRDDLRQSRQVAGGGQGGTSSRPSPGFIHAQQTVDRMVAGEWATLGWAGAYTQPIKSSLANDLMGAMGLRAAPQSMWQREYEQMSKSMLTDRIASFPTDLLMPGFGRRSRDMGAQLYQMSSRFGRAGDNLDNNFHATMNMGREMQIGAATDMRLSGQDYGTILQHSAQAGQFDFAGGLGDVKTQFNELRSAVADLTKTMRLGAGEVAQTMGAFRQFGIVDVADQKRMAERMGATSRVAGISTPEMAEMARAGAMSGMQYGIGAQGSMALAENLAMAARTSSRSGLISGHVMAAGGGVQGIVQAQQQAIQQFVGSSAGYYTALGMAGGDQGSALGNLMSGIGATGGTLGGIVSAEARRMDLMGNMSAAQQQRIYNRSIQQQMQMLGVDPNGPNASDYAFSLVRGQMGDAAGLTYARQNFSEEGRRGRWQESYRTQMQLVNQREQRDYQLAMENESFGGRLRQMSGRVGADLGKFGMGVGRGLSWLSRGFGGTFDWGNGTFQEAQQRQIMNGDDELSASSAIAAAMEAERSNQAGQSREAGIRLTGSVSGWKAWTGSALKVGFAVGGMVAGAGIGAGLVSVGTGIAGAVAGAGVGTALAGALGLAGETSTELFGDAAANYRLAYAGSTGGISQRAANIATGKSGQVLNALSGNQAFQQLVKKSERGTLSDVDSKEFARLAGEAGRATGIGADDVLGVVRALGVDFQMQGDYNIPAAAMKRYETKMHDVLDAVESSKLSIASSDVASGVAAYASAKGATDQNKARAQLTAAGITGRSMDNLTTAVDKLGEGDRAQLAKDAIAYNTVRGSRAVDKRMTAFTQMAEGMAIGAGTPEAKEAYERIRELGKDPKALMEVMLGGGDAKDAALRDFLKSQDDTGMMRNLGTIGSMTDLMDASQDEAIKQAAGISDADLSTLREMASRSPIGERQGGMKRALSAMMIGSSTAVKQSSDPVNVAANNMMLAANILKEIYGKITHASATDGN
jgi:hypothetical protein